MTAIAALGDQSARAGIVVGIVEGLDVKYEFSPKYQECNW